MNPRQISRMTGVLLLVVAAFIATGAIWGMVEDDFWQVQNFLIAAVIPAGLGAIGLLLGRGAPRELHARDAIAVVALGWLLVGACGAIPYMLEGVFSHPADAFFESVSGLTTTGSTVLTDIESLSLGLHYWRTLTHWMGGMGIIVLFIAIFPQLGVGARHLFRSEVPGPITERLRPKVKQTSLVLWYIYLGLTAAETVILMLSGLDFHTSLCHSFATMATGGFSTLNASVAGFGSVWIETVILVFMLLAGINFSLYFRCVGGDWRIFGRDHEFRAYVVMMAVATVLVTVSILHLYPNVWTALRYAAFQVVAMQTTTGFGTDNFNVYPPFAKIILVGLMLVGGMAGSTAGGMKVSRWMVLLSGIKNELVHTFRTHGVFAVKIGRRAVAPDVVHAVFVFLAAYLLLLFIGALFLGLLGLDVVTATTATISALSNIGPGLERVGSIENYAFIPVAGKVLLSFLMILGRLELFTILVLLVPSFWRK